MKTAEEFWKRVNKSETCWFWEGAKCSDGYGTVRWIDRTCSTHRKAWELVNGAVPDGLSVLHQCDQRGCVNPEHLFLGTQTDNMQDAAIKGRLFGRATATGDRHGSHTRPESVRRGTTNGRSTLTRTQVMQIRALYPSMTQEQLGKKYGVDQITISRIVRRKTYVDD